MSAISVSRVILNEEDGVQSYNLISRDLPVLRLSHPA